MRSETPAGLAATVHACLAKDPALRPSASALAAALEPDTPLMPVAPVDLGPDVGTEVLPLGTTDGGWWMEERGRDSSKNALGDM